MKSLSTPSLYQNADRLERRKLVPKNLYKNKLLVNIFFEYKQILDQKYLSQNKFSPKVNVGPQK